MTVALPSRISLKAQWRDQIIRRRGRNWIQERRGLVSIAFLDRSQSDAEFVEIDNIVAFVVYEDEHRNLDGSKVVRIPLRLSAYRVSRVENGVLWGGAENAALFKDLMLTPNHQARGQRIDLRSSDLLGLGLELDSWLSRAARHPGLRRPRLRLPRLCAGFRAREAGQIHGEGPEFE